MGFWRGLFFSFRLFTLKFSRSSDAIPLHLSFVHGKANYYYYYYYYKVFEWQALKRNQSTPLFESAMKSCVL